MTSNTATLTVTTPPATLESITVAPASATIEQGQTQQFSATGSYSDGGSQDLTSTATWTSSDTTAATIDSTGLASGLAPGAAGITAALDGVTSNTATAHRHHAAGDARVDHRRPGQRHDRAGPDPAVQRHRSYSDGGSQDLTSTATWTSSDTTAATIDSTGLASGLAPGAAGITAALDGVTSNTATLTVFGILGITPQVVQAGDSVTVTIAGAGFAAGAGVTFENGQGPSPSAANVTVDPLGTAITAIVNSKSGGPRGDRVWDVRVTNPDGRSAALVQGFTVRR